jgi:hypothetical protein
MVGGRSASLQSAEQNAHRIDDEYGRISAYEIHEDDFADDRDPKEVEREKYGDRKENLGLFGGAVESVGPPTPAASAAEVGGATLEPVPALEDVIDADRDDNGAAGVRVDVDLRNGETLFAGHAAALQETPITPELNALEIVPLDGIRDKKVKEIALEVPYPRVTEQTVKRIREIFEDHIGEVPVSVTLTDVPKDVAGGQVRMKISHHFRVQPGPALNSALQQIHATPRYIF